MPTTITTLPTPPNRGMSADTFSSTADAFLSALPNFGTQANALASDCNGYATAAASSASTASTAATTATTAATTASNAAITVTNSANTSSTSTSTLTIGLGAQSLTITTGKAIVVGMSYKIASTATPTIWMVGDVTSYNSITGAMTVNITTVQGAGTFSSWTCSLATVPQQVLDAFTSVLEASSVSYTYSGGRVATSTEVILGSNKITTYTYNTNGTLATEVITFLGKTRTKTYSYTGSVYNGFTATEV